MESSSAVKDKVEAFSLSQIMSTHQDDAHQSCNRQKKHFGTDFNWYINWHYRVAPVTVWIFDQEPQRNSPK
jgi:hypothetical protein